jgi:RNA 3'-terminal phosphate cyclase (ATP)
MMTIDAGTGEGGGQLFRTALALSAVSGTPVRICRIRSRRQPPGLKPQHLTAVEALAEISAGTLEGAAPGSQDVTFVPGPLRSGTYRFDLGTAGSTALVLQSLLLPLAGAGGVSQLTLTGGTHVPWSPPASFLDAVLFPVLGRMGLGVRLRVDRWGFYPKGGGRIVVTIGPAAGLAPLTLVRRTGRDPIQGLSVVAGLPRSIAERQRDRALARLAAQGWQADIEIREVESGGPGTCLFLAVNGESACGGATALGERGRPAEDVADAAVTDLLAFLDSETGCDPHLADQLILPMALASGTSRLTTSRITGHLLSAIELIRAFLGCPVQVSGTLGEAGSVTLEGVGGRIASREPRAESRGVAPECRARRGAPRGPGAESVQPETESQKVIVRKPQAADGPAIQRLLAHFATKGELLPRTLHEVYRNLRDFVVAEIAGEVVGVCALSLYWEDLSEIRSLAVHEAHGGRGVGSALVEACLDEAAGLGIGRAFALTYRPGFFERMGFRVLDKRELPQKIWKDCVQCARFNCCDEVALICDLPSRRQGRDPGADAPGVLGS